MFEWQLHSFGKNVISGPSASDVLQLLEIWHTGMIILAKSLKNETRVQLTAKSS